MAAQRRGSAARATARTAPKIPGLVFVQPLGSGGYADVFLYEQQSPRMPVAVKVLKAEGLTDTLRRQFVEEADTMAALGDHPYIVQVFRSGTSDDGRPYLVMKYYPPPNLAMRARADRFSVEEVLRTGIQLASAVETAHRARITHRDIKPANVLVSAYGAPGLTDFGIAGRGARDDESGETGEVEPDSTDDVGVSVPWAPPEVLYGQSNGDERADVYSLAATLWQLLVGRSPFEVPGGDNSAYALMPRIRSTPPPRTGRADVPAGLERLLGQAMAKDPAHRPASALALARALQAVEQDQRLARTPIVVLDEQGHTTLVSQTQGSPTGRSTEDDDRTRVKAPQTVLAQPVLPPPTSPPSPSSATPEVDDATRRRADGEGRRLSPPPVSPHAAGGSALLRPAATTDPTSSRTAPLSDSAVRDELADPTVRRAPVVAGGAAAGSSGPGPTQAPSAFSRPSVVWGLVASVAVLIGALVFLLLRPGSSPVPPGQTAPSPTISMPGDTAAVDGGLFTKPVVKAASGTGVVTFTWSYPEALPGDTFRLLLAPTASDAVSTDRSRPARATTPTYAVKAAAGTPVCIVVFAVRSGQESPPSQPQCETTQ